MLEWRQNVVQAKTKKTRHTIWLPEDVSRDLRVITAYLGMTLAEVVEDAVRAWLAQDKQKCARSDLAR